MTKKILQASRLVLTISTSLLASFAQAGSNFTITPDSSFPFPDKISANGTVSAYYKVINNTHSTRSGYTVKGLPASVVHNSSNPYCSNPITLPGQDHCTLRLDISKPVQSGFALCKGTSCTRAAVDLNVRAGSTASGAVLLAVGKSGDATPLLVQSSNGGSAWSVVTVPQLPARGVFNGASCTGSGSTAICTAVGKDSSGDQPLLVQSTNGGSSWSVVSVPSLPAIDSFSGASCTGSGSTAICTAVGEEDSENQPPVLVQSTNGGSSWSVVSVPNLPAIGTFSGASCTGSGSTAICTAVGQDGTDNSALLVQSKNGGSSWSVVSVPNLPAIGSFNSASCTGSGSTAICIAVGTYSTGDVIPLLVQSTNGGSTWSVVTVPKLPAIGNFWGASCTGSGSTAICTAVGQDGTDNSALLVQSKNGGSSWSVVSVPNLPAIGYFRSASCTGSGSTAICIAVGTDATGDEIPLLVQSTNGGSTWSVVSVPNLPAIGTFSGASCTGSGSTAICTAVGQDLDDNQALLVQSTNGGSTWSVVTVSNLPISGSFNGTSGASAYAPASLSLLEGGNYHR